MSRPYFSLILLASLGALGIALISQHTFGLRPCAWCVFQRVLVMVIGILAALGAVLPSRFTKARQVLRVLISLTALGGLVAAWYQYRVAATLFSCDLGFADQFMIKSGLESALPWLFGIYGTCMEASVAVLGVDYALWALIWFGLVGFYSGYAALRPPRSKNQTMA